MHLTELDLIKPDWQYRHGLQVVDLSEKDRRVLSCAKNSPYNGHEFRMPFQRFLWLRFIQMPLDLIQFELKEKNLLDCSKYDSKFLMRRHEQFLAGVPEELRDCVEENRPPKTKEEKELFDILLDVCELRIAYEHPTWDDALRFMNDPNVKTIIDSALSTMGTYEQVSMFIHEVLGVSITDAGLLFYQQLFHDMSMMTAADLKEYFKGISPSRKQELQRAHGTPLDVYKLQSGLQANIRADEVIDVALNQIAKKILDLTSHAGSVDSDEAYKAIRAFNILVDRHTRVIDVARSTTKEATPDFFKTLSLAPQDVSHGKILIGDPNNPATV